MIEKIEKTEAEWREQLTDQQHHVTREAATEAPFASRNTGIYRCAYCGQILFGSKAKYDSSTGWPSS